MTDPSRLLELEVDAFEREILLAGRADRHTVDAFKRTAAAIGLTATGSAAATTALAASGGVSAGMTKGGIAAALAISKWAVIGVAAGIITLIGADHLGFLGTSAPPSHVVSKVGASSSVPAFARQDLLETVRLDSSPSTSGDACEGRQCADAGAVGSISTSSVVGIPLAPSGLSHSPVIEGDEVFPEAHSGEWAAPTEAPSIAASPPRTWDTPPAQAVVVDGGQARGATALASQLAAIDSARRMLRAGDCRRSLDAVAAYLWDYPNGVLAPEAHLLRVEALVGCGDNAAARALAQRLLQNNPSAPYAKRLRAAIGAAH